MEIGPARHRAKTNVQWNPEDRFAMAESSTPSSFSGVSNIATRVATVSMANAIIALVYEQKRTNELLEQLLAK